MNAMHRYLSHLDSSSSGSSSLLGLVVHHLLALVLSSDSDSASRSFFTLEETVEETVVVVMTATRTHARTGATRARARAAVTRAGVIIVVRDGIDIIADILDLKVVGIDNVLQGIAKVEVTGTEMITRVNINQGTIRARDGRDSSSQSEESRNEDSSTDHF